MIETGAPPQVAATSLLDNDAEREVLAALAMHGPEALAVIRDLMPGHLVFSPANRQLAEVLFTLASEGTPGHSGVIVRARAHELGYAGLADAAQEILAELLTSFLGDLKQVPHYARIVVDLAARRALVDASTAIAKLAHDRAISPQSSMGELVDRLMGEVQGVTQDTTKDYLVEALEDIERDSQWDGGVPGISSGIAPLDNLTDGWMTPRLIVLAARPGFGKTATGLWCADMAGQSEVETVFVSVEQPTKQLQKRRLAMRTGIDLRGVRNRERYAQALPDLMAETAKMRHEPLTFVQGPRSVRAIRLELQRMIAKGRHPKVVVIDYLTKLRSDRKAERHDLAVGDITGDLCRMAIDLECTILLLAQLNRESVKDGKVRRPTVSDLRDSGIIEQDADQILLLWPGAPSDDDIPMAPGSGVVPFEMLLDKNRHGPKGSVRLNWWEATGRFEVPTYLPRIARYG